MKQLIFLFSVLAILSACNKSGGGLQGTKDLATEMDSISYAVGRFFAEQVAATGIDLNAQQMAQGLDDMNQDIENITEEQGMGIMRGFQQAIAMRQGAPFTKEDPAPFSVDSVCYVIGADFARNMKEFDVSLSSAAFLQGSEDFKTEAPSLVGDRQDALMQMLTTKIQEKQNAELAVKAESSIAEGKTFLAEKATEEGVKSTPSGLMYKVLTEGTGAMPVATDNVTVHYEGRLIDGTVFDSSIARGEPASFPLNGVIAGWTEGVQLMKTGAKYQFYIPQDLAYGLQGSPPNIPPGATLIFDVELISIDVDKEQ